MVWSEYGYVVASDHRTKVVLSLHDHPKTPTQISGEIGLGIAHVSRVLKQLADKDVVTCLTPGILKGKVYGLTEKGKLVAKIIKEDRERTDK